MSRKKILFLTPRFPYPMIGGDRLKPYHLLSHLAKHYDVTLVSFSYSQFPQKSYIEEIEKLGVEVFPVVQNPTMAVLGSGFRLMQRYPLEISFYLRKDFRQLVDKLTKERKFDLGIAFFMRTAEYIKNKNFKKLLISEDCRTLYQYRSYKESTSLLQKGVRFWDYFKLKRYEPRIVNHFDAVSLVSPEDIVAMKEQNSNANYKLLTNGTDLEKYAFNENFEERKSILFTGKLDLWANQLMIMRIVNEILPIVRQKYPNILFEIVGARPSSSILALQSKFVKVHPNVPELVPYLQRARVFLHPHIGGSGIQNKLLEAMACGAPVVTTFTGNQGIHAKHKFEALIGESSEELAQHTLTFLENEDLSKSISYNARKLMEETHSWSAVFNQLDHILKELL